MPVERMSTWSSFHLEGKDVREGMMLQDVKCQVRKR